MRLVLDFGEVIEVDGSELYDPAAEREVPAVVIRLSGARAHWLGTVLEAYTRVCDLVGTVDTVELPAAWALHAAALAADPTAAHYRAAARPVDVSGGQRLRSAAVLREQEDLDDTTLMAVVDSAARWLAEADGVRYAYALLGAVTDQETQDRAYYALTGGAA
jgi:hypothetical protein